MSGFFWLYSLAVVSFTTALQVTISNSPNLFIL
jgi:hypothetical protein